MYGLGMAKGLLVTLKNLTKRPFTVQYPEERLKQHPRFRGEEFVWYEERCTGCASCAKYCPLGIIKIVTTPSGTAPLQGDKYLLEVFDIDITRCMFCGLCVEACPYDALFMGSGFEQGQYSRKDMVISIDQLRQSGKRPSTFLRTQLESSGYNPHQGQSLDWKDVGRESWRWHQREKAGMRLTPPASQESETRRMPPVGAENSPPFRPGEGVFPPGETGTAAPGPEVETGDAGDAA